ncbi:MAG: AAA family ATPase, partial [Anaerolineae bacterium]|nr:AAA family ATPase [Anaerolineae bacterium]
ASQAALAGSGAIAQTGGVAAGEAGAAIGRDVGGDVVLGDKPTALDLRGAQGPLYQPGGPVEQQFGDRYYYTAPPLPALPRLYYNLPQPDYGAFIGRQQELAQIHSLLLPYPRSRYHIITIAGIGGIGKSALALEAASRYVHEHDALPLEERFDAIIWASAKQTILTAEGIISRRAKVRTLDDIYTTIAATLERDDITQARPEDRAAVVARALTRQRTLLIVDNLETVDDEQVIAFIREAPDPTKVIVTTRQHIAVAYPIRLIEMPWEDARQLIAQECKKQGVALTDEQARQLYDRTGGVPLALVWSISRVALGEDVARVLQLLARADSDIARFCFKGVVQHLRDNESYKLLVASAMFAGDAPRAALGSVAGIEDEESCADGLLTLERLSLLNKQADRFSLLPLTRSFLDHELRQMPAFTMAAFERLLAFYIQFVRPPQEVQIGDPYWDGLLNYNLVPRLEQEWHNVAHILRRVLDERRGTDALALFLPILHLMNRLGLWDERLEFGLDVCRAARDLNDPSEAWLWMDAVAWVYSNRRQMSKYIDAIRTGKSLAQQFNLSEALAYAEAHEARWYGRAREMDLARRRIASALDRIGIDTVLEHGNRLRRVVASRIVVSATWISELDHDLERAKKLLELELALRASIGENISPVLSRLGSISLELHDLVSAEKYLAQALVGDWPKERAWANYRLALIAEQRGEMQEARHLCQLALQQLNWLGMSNVQEVQKLLARLPGPVAADEAVRDDR